MKNDLINELGTNFIEYAVAVNTDRAIPDAKSGLKPVAKRIIWSAFENGRTYSKPHVKSARIVGDTMGAYHPHGDSSIYEAMIRLSQEWVMRYPLIDIHGNNGNIAGDGPAAARYTEARLSKIAEAGLLNGIKKRNVDFATNYDETLDEPITLPAIFPNLICNPNSGIGVAMACNWLPHNLNEVANAIYQVMNGEEPMLPGPDFPTGGVIINKNDIPAIMATGHGSVKVRGKYNIEKQKIIFYEIPYGTTIEGLLTEIGAVCDNKDIEGIDEIRDESNKKGLRIVIQCEKNTNPDAIVKKLFLKTNLQTSISYNQVALVDKTPTELNLKDCINIYIKHNLECLVKEAKFDIEKAEKRLNIVKGLLIALEDIDNIINKIKTSENASAAKIMLIKDYQMNEEQAKAVLDMKLAKLAKLEKIEIEKEEKELIDTVNKLNNFILSKEEQKNELKNRLNTLVKQYGDERKTELVQIDIKPEEKEIEEVIPENVVVIATQNGDIKRIAATAFKTQRRNGKGVKSESDAILSMISTNTIDNLLLFTNKGKMYRLLVDNIPAGTNASKGDRIANLINLEPDEKVMAITSLDRKIDKKYVIFITKNGLFKKSNLDEYTSTRKSTGIAAIKLKEGDSIANVTFANEEDFVVITKKGMSIRFETTDIAPIGRNTSGVKSIKLNGNDEVLIGLPIEKNSKDELVIITSKGLGKKISLDELVLQGRGGKGIYIYKPNEINGNVAGAILANKDNSILVVGKPNSICISATDLPLLSRISAGNIVIKNSQVNSIIKI